MKRDDLSELFETIDVLKNQGHVFLVKFDGERSDNAISTVAILKSEEEAIQFHGNDLVELLNKLLTEVNRKIS